MAQKISIQVAGGTVQNKDGVRTVGEAKALVGADGYTATVNGEPQGDDYVLSDYEFVSLAKPVKAG